jgi:hypothetical protein
MQLGFFGGLFNLQVAAVRSSLKSVAMSDYFGHYFYYKAGVEMTRVAILYLLIL